MSTLSQSVKNIRAKLDTASAELAALEYALNKQDETPEGNNDLILLEEMASILRISVTTARRWLHDGKLDPVHKKGRTYYWLRSELEQVLRNSDEMPQK